MELAWGERTWVMGIINLTPDSFSGDGLAPDGRPIDEVVGDAVAQGRRFVEEGAQILDVGAESSRPAQFYGEHPPISAEDERALVTPVVEALVTELGDRTLVSVDTTKGSVARAALGAGARLVNDVWAGQRDPDTLAAAADGGAHLVLMHNREVAEYPDGVVPEVVAFLQHAMEGAIAAGVPRESLIIDPGIGFGKTPAHSIEVLHRAAEIKERLGGLPMLIGTSRKRVLGELLGGAAPDERLEGSLATVALAVAAGADIVRVHDVAASVRVARVADGIVRWDTKVDAKP